MPAPKSESSPHDSEPQIKTMDEDEEDLPSKTSPACHNRSLKRGIPREKTAPPWTMKKLSASAEGGNKLAKSSKQSSPPKESSKTSPDPPIKKAKLLNATSASCGEAPTQKTNSKAPLKRTASTESEDELSSDGSKSDPFRERDDGDKARCIRKYSNRVKAKRRAEELSFVPQDKSQGSPSAPPDTIQMDHNYGRFSDSSSIQSLGDVNLDEVKENAQSTTETQSPDVLVHSTKSSESEVSITGTEIASSEHECVADVSKHEESELSDSTAPTDEGYFPSESGNNEKNNMVEPIGSQKAIDVETLAQTQYPCTPEALPGCEGEAQAGEKTDSSCVSAAAETKQTSQPVSEERKLDINCTSTEGEFKLQEVMEETSVSANFGVTAVEHESLSTESNSAQDGILVEVSDPESQTEESLTAESVANPDAQTDPSSNIQEESKSERLQAGVSHETLAAITNSCDNVHKTVSEPEGSKAKGVEHQMNTTVPGSSAELQPSGDVMDKMTDGCTKIQTPDCDAMHEQNQREVFSNCVTASEGQRDMSKTEITPEHSSDSPPKEVLHNQENHKTEDHATEVEVKENISAERAPAQSSQMRTDMQSSATSQEESCNQAAPVETVVSECDSQTSTDSNDDHVVNSNIMENQEEINFEHTSGPENPANMEEQTALTEISNPGGQEASGPTASMSPEHHQDVTMEDSGEVQNEDEVDFECPPERPTTVTSQSSHPATTVEVQIQESPEATEHITDMSGEIPNYPVANGQSSEDEGKVEEGMRTAEVTDEMPNVTPTVETQTQNNQEAPQVAPDVLDKVEEGLMIEAPESNEYENMVDTECISETVNQRELDLTATAEELSDPLSTAETQNQRDQEVGEVPADTEAQEDFIITNNESEVNKDEGVAGCVDQREMKMEATPEKVFNPSSAVEVQSSGSLDICELNADVQNDPVSESRTSQAAEAEPRAECADASEAQINMDTTTTAEVSNPASAGGEQIQESLEISELNTEVQEDQLTVNDEGKADEDKLIPEYLPFQSTVTSEEIPHQPSDVEVQSQRSLEISELNTEVTKGSENEEEEKPTAECVDDPQAQINMETTATAERICDAAPAVNQQDQKMTEVTEPPAASFDEIQESHPAAASESKDAENMESSTDVAAVSGPMESKDSGLEEETVREVIHEVKEEPAIISSDKADTTLSSSEGREGGTAGNDVAVVCGQPGDADLLNPQPEEQIKMVHQSEVELPENQVVYEPISSPESNDDRDISAAPENHDGVSLLEIQNAETQQMEGDSSTHEESEEKPPESREVEMEEQTMPMPENCVSAELEQNNLISSSDDVTMSGGQFEDSKEIGERSKYPNGTEVSEQMDDVSGLQEATDVTVTTTTTDKTTDEIPDSTSEEFVILEPVPQSEIDFDIVTQAAAQSGLSVTFTEQVNPGGAPEGLNGSQLMVLPEAETTDEVRNATADSSVAPDQEISHGTDASTGEGGVQNSDHCQQPSAGMMDVDTAENDATDSHTQVTSEDCNAAVMEKTEGNLDLQEVQILEDIELGREIVVAEEDNEEDGDISIIEKPQETPKTVPCKKPEDKGNEKSKDDTCGKSVKQNSTAENAAENKKGPEGEKPKKQEMNTQARTKARLAALAEQKAAASKRSANRQQLNLLALCQEIAEDIATDSMLLKRIEEEKQAAAAAAAVAAAAATASAAEVASKSEASEEESPSVNTQDAGAANVATPPGPEGGPESVAPAEEASTATPSAPDSAEAKPAGEPQKRRFFITQVSVPLKAHEKKKLTRYQRLRQVELQREKMSWARVKKLKSDQANQMFSDIDWQAPLSAFSQFSMSPVSSAPPPPVSSPKSPLPGPGPASTSKPATPNAEAPMPDTPQDEPAKTEPAKTETPKAETSKPEPVKSEVSKADPPAPETRKSTRQSKAQTPKETPSPGPTPKVTRSAAKNTLPAVPPPMPNGLSAQKQKPVEYKPYRPRPKYSFDDFELDDDPVPVAPAKPSPQMRPGQVARPGVQSNAAAQSKPTVQTKPTAPSHLSNQARLKAPQTTPARQVSGQSKPAIAATPQTKAATAAAGSSKAVPLAKPQLKSSVSSTPQSKAASAPGQAKPSASPVLKPTGGGATARLKQSTSTASQTAGSTPSAAPVGLTLQKAAHPPTSEESNCKDSADRVLSAPASSVPSGGGSKVPDGTQQSGEKPAAADPSPDKTQAVKTAEKTEKPCQDRATRTQDGGIPLSDTCLQKDIKKLKEADKDGTQTIIDAGQKHFGAVACSVCGMLYSAANPEDESQHLLFHNQFISAVKYVGWKKERILAEYPDGKIILVLPDDPKYALRKVEEIREVVDSDLGFQQVETKCPSKTKTFLFISNDKKVGGCLIAEHIQEGYRVIEEPLPEGSEGEKVMFERQRAWCCSTTPEPAICGISRIWVVSMMRRQGIASRMLECLRNNFVYGSYLSKDEIAFSDPTPDGKLFATHYFGTSQFLVYNFVSGTHSSQPKSDIV